MYTNGGNVETKPLDEEAQMQVRKQRANELFYLTFFASLMLVMSFALWITYLAVA